ncbi:DUF1257 domain-containing protein [Planctomicrobium sp. SH661]|uniref:DUF1257 domain-containing protein n=1 Tax=Planctomicrobium sp. SH661 TaxID=3448124 RepID=UPI003F5BB10B
MSHIVTIQVEIRDPIAIQAACQRLHLPEPTSGQFQMFTATAAGWGVQLPGWRYPVVCDIEQRQLHFDNYGGRWGEPLQLDRFLQAYAVEKSMQEARRAGHSVQELLLPDGTIQLTLEVGGAA